MIKDFIIVCLLWLMIRFVWLIDLPTIHDAVVGFISSSQASLLTGAVLGALGIVVVAYLLSAVRVYPPLYLLSRLTFEVSQFAIVLLSVFAVILRFDCGLNLWAGLGIAASVPFLFLGASCAGFWLYDFNYPLQQRLARNIVVPVLSGVAIWAASLAG